MAPRPWSSKAQCTLGTKTPSSTAQRLIKCKRAAKCNKPSSATSQPTTAAPGLAVVPQVFGTVSQLGPTASIRPPRGITMPAPISMGLQAAIPVLGRGDDVADLCSRFGALCITAARSRTPSGPQGSRASLGPKTGGCPRQSTLSGTKGASTTNQPVSGAPSVPPSSHIPRHQTKQRPISVGGTSSKPGRGVGGILASPPSSTAFVVSTAHTSLATKTPSSPALKQISCKRASRATSHLPAHPSPLWMLLH